MTKEEIVKELDELGNVLYNKFGTDSYLERCTIHDLKAKIKALIIADVSNCGDYAKNRPNGIQNDEWWCPNCNEVVPSHDVTNDERHGIDGCLTKVC